ncbi:MAG: hypothetical protein ACOYD4_04030 [Solirubrobacterales bacterium]
MASVNCSKAALVPEAACYNGKQFTIHEQLALEVYFRMQTVKAVGGADYTDDEDTLAIDAQNILGGTEPDQQRAIELAILANNADASGAAVSANPGTLKGFIAVLSHYDDAMLQKMRLLLMCEQGANVDQPQ